MYVFRIVSPLAVFLLAPLRAREYTNVRKAFPVDANFAFLRRLFFHETTKTPREVFGSHQGESLSSLLVKVTMTPPLSLRQAITSSPRAAVVAMKTPVVTRMAGAHGGDSGNSDDDADNILC
jgi:hypothetical protein